MLVHRGHKKIKFVWNRSGESMMIQATREEYLRARERHFALKAKELREAYDKLPVSLRTDDSGIRELEALARAVRADLDALGPQDRGLPACLPNPHSTADAKTPYWSYGRQCEPGFMLGRPNRALYAKAGSRTGIATLVFETDAGRTGAVEPYLHEYKLALLNAFDFAGVARALPAAASSPEAQPLT